MSQNGPRTSVTLGDVIKSTDRATNSPKIVSKDGEDLESFSLQIYIPNDVDEAKIGEPSVILRKGQYINFRLHSNKEIGEMPDWKRPLAQLKAWMSLGKK